MMSYDSKHAFMAKNFLEILKTNIGKPGFKWVDYELQLKHLLDDAFDNGVEDCNPYE